MQTKWERVLQFLAALPCLALLIALPRRMPLWCMGQQGSRCAQSRKVC